eukprot:TRINITY_DN30229_c0_g1_i2.p1 TRINITY_DN30229_c0_g1~~TRINITY_DN30229_c0_g1_i2.p1  ORF type:complete len:997 (+),score=132.01 TRINITY_DN30229_c0_g1_i2:396-3386(+)
MLRQKKGSERSKPGHGDSRSKERKSSRSGEDSSPKYTPLDSGSRDKNVRRENDTLKRQLCSPMLGVSTSSDEDLDNDLRQGIDNIMKLRDEYDKLEGALKKLGVDPECVVTEEEDGYNAESDLEDDTEQDCEREVETFVPAVYSVGGGAVHRPGRLLDRVDEVDESMLSEECLDDELPPPPCALPPPPSYPGIPNPFVQMSLPGGGIVSMPLDSSRVGSPDPSLGHDVLSVTAGEPVTHFNLDQLLEIVQSFQLDTTHAHGTGQEKSQSHKKDVDSMSMICSGTGTSVDEQDTRATHSCPSSPTETECSSGFSTLRRRSVNVTEKVRQNKDGSKIQVVRESAVSTSSANEPNQSVTFQQNSFVYINGSPEPGGLGSGCVPTNETFQNRSDIFMPSCQPFSSLVPSSSVPETSLYNSGPSQGACSASSQNTSGYRGHIVRLNSIEPNTVMFSTKDYPLLIDVSVPEIIDELERQFDSKLCEVQGVRLAGTKIFICLSHRDCLNHLAQYGFYVRGVHVTVMDISNDSVVVCLIGVPHYITDSTITMLVGTFGICIGEVERRFYKGVDTGERYVRLKPKGSTQIPDYVTVGGCKILIRVLTQEEVGQPFTLHSVTSRSEPVLTSTDTVSIASGLAVSSGSCQPGPTYRAKPGHCNGSLNSPNCSEMPPSLPPLTLSGIPSCGLSSGILSPPPIRTGADSAGSSISLPSSPKIARSFRSRISVTLRSPPNPEDINSSTYVPGESVDGIPVLSPPAYRNQAVTGNGSALCIGNGKGIDGLSNIARPSSSSMDDPSIGTSSTLKKTNRESPSASSLRKYAIQNNNMHKTESSLSVNSVDRMGGSLSDSASKDANSSMKRASVVFEEPKGGNFTAGNSSLLAQNRQVSTSKTVNGILRKGSLRGDEEKTRMDPGTASRKSRKSGDHRHKSERSHSSSSKSSRLRSSKLDSVNESGDDPDGSEKRSSRSRSNSTKSTKSEKKDANNIALTRDLPWCGCWGNGCL